MRFSVLSDLHLGAALSALNPSQGPQGSPAFLKLIELLKSKSDKLDYLILSGDIFDLSLVSFKEAWACAQKFFSLLDAANVTDKIIYLPGNHDFTMWHYFEQDIHVTRRTQSSPPSQPEDFLYSVPGFLNTNGQLQIPQVNQGKSKGTGFGGGFFKGIWSGPGKEFAVVYPNLYVLGPTGTTLITHGQYFDGFWNFLGKLCLKGADRFLDNKVMGELTISELVQVNYPTSVLDASAIGQSGIFSKLAQDITKDVSTHDFSKIQAIKNALLSELDTFWSYKGDGRWYNEATAWLKEWGTDQIIRAATAILDRFIEKFKEEKGTRFNEDYIAAHQNEIKEFLQMSIRELRTQSPLEGQIIERLIFGHTHIPTCPEKNDKSVRIDPSSPEIPCRNLGGWVMNNKGNFRAGVAIFDSASSPVWQMYNIDSNGIGLPFPI